MAIRRTSNNSINNAVKLSTGFASAAIPNTPTIGTATKVDDVSATVTYTAAVLGATASSFTALSSPGSLTGTGSSPITISGLTPDTAYTFTVRASNANGNSAYSTASNSITTDPISDTGAMFPLGMVSVGSGGAANITFSSIPSTYTHLQIRGIAKNSSSNVFANNVDIRFNSDTGNNYAWHLLYGVGTSPVGASATASTSLIAYAGLAIGANTANVFGATIIDILDYKNTNKFKTLRALVGGNSNTTATAEQYIGLGSGLWQNTNAISTITLTPNAGNFTQYTSFALYGIKGA